MRELKLYETKIETWVLPITMRALSEHDAQELARFLFKIPTHIKITAVPVDPEPDAEEVKDNDNASSSS